MTIHQTKIATFDGSTVSKRVPTTMDGILDELGGVRVSAGRDAEAQSAVERCSERVTVARPGRARG